MISIIVPTVNAQEHLPRCFNGLISAAASGLVREVIVADGGSTDDTQFIADAAGAHIVEAGKSRAEQLAAGAKTAKSDWLLFLHPETTLAAGWEQEVEAFLERCSWEEPRAAVFQAGVDASGAGVWLREFGATLRGLLFARPSGRQGLLISRRLYQKIGGYDAKHAREDSDIARRIGRRRIVMLRTRAILSGAKFRDETARSGILAALKVPARALARIYR